VGDVVATPSQDEVRKYLKLWRDQGNENTNAALQLLFQTMPRNIDTGEVAVKVAALNGLYATNIYGVVQMARHIVGLDIDDLLETGVAEPELIEDIARLTQKGKLRRHYSFATKYCSFHRPDVYPIYDSLVAEILNALLRQGETFDKFLPGETWSGDYGVYCRSVLAFRQHYGLDEFSVRDVDKYLWMAGKERRATVQSVTKAPKAPS
jgi:hypothetical protein